MDPLTQGVLGASLPQASAKSSEVRAAGLLGFLAGMSADLDVLIRSSADPLLFLEYHRQFTHALIFIPIGGLLCAALLYPLLGKRRQLSFATCFKYCMLGYATHALLDSCTTYGTMLFWPFSDVRIAWNTVSIIDPLFTGPILVLVVLAAKKKREFYGRLAVLWALCYLSLGVLQRNAAVDMGNEIAASRGHVPISLEAKPSFANILVWKTVYETQDRYYVDAVRVGPSPAVYQGDSIEKLDIARDFSWLDLDSQQARDIERFRWFSNGYIAKDPLREDRIIDIRYSMVPNELAPLWSIQLSKDASASDHVDYKTHRDTSSGQSDSLRRMLFGGG
ncbi:MAG: metal-dependent hydrolase [Halioglobus sp.]